MPQPAGENDVVIDLEIGALLVYERLHNPRHVPPRFRTEQEKHDIRIGKARLTDCLR